MTTANHMIQAARAAALTDDPAPDSRFLFTMAGRARECWAVATAADELSGSPEASMQDVAAWLCSAAATLAGGLADDLDAMAFGREVQERRQA